MNGPRNYKLREVTFFRRKMIKMNLDIETKEKQTHRHR